MIGSVQDQIKKDSKESSATRKDFIKTGFNFLEKVGKKGIRVSAIVGSTSYEPIPEDDIDIFLVTDKNLLWVIVFRSLLIRRLYRFDKICLSLFMDEGYSVEYFKNLKDKLIIADARHAIIYYGDKFYSKLLSYIGDGCDDIGIFDTLENETRNGRSSVFDYLLNFLSMIIVLPPILLKGMVNSKRLEKYDQDFKVVYGWRKFYLNSKKYENLRRAANGTDQAL